jgi:asparagine synthase (glutamine-hydrolysing)
MLQAQQDYGTRSALADGGAIALGRNLFPLLPEDSFDRGPVERSHFLLAADVRLDNRGDLGAGLGISAPEQSRMSDASLLFECLLKWGEAAIDRLVGEFAFAFWDGAQQRLLLARDIFGYRPLYFHEGERFFAFSTMPSGLHVLADVPYDFDAEFMAESLALLPHVGRKTQFREIQRVEPAHYASVTRGKIASQRYWNPSGPSGPPKAPSEYEEGVRSVFETAVAAQLRGAGDAIATHLSAGLDSSAVTSTAARLFAPGRVIAFTAVPRAGFEGAVPDTMLANEAELATATARLYPNIEHVLVESSAESPLAALDREHVFQQQPVANLCNAVWGRGIHRIAQSRGLKVLLEGGAGNMSISYAGLEWLSVLVARGRLLDALRCASALASNGASWLTLGARLSAPFLPRAAWEFASSRRGRITDLRHYSSVAPDKIQAVERSAQESGFDLAYRPRTDPFETRLRALGRYDGGNFYKGTLAQWGLSVRAPMADKRVIEYCLAVPFEEYVRGGLPRSIARRAFADRLPKEVIGSRTRGYQAADWYESLGRDVATLREEAKAIARCSSASAAMDVDWLQQTAASWPDGGWARQDVIMRHRWGLLRAISAGHFMRKVAGTN